MRYPTSAPPCSRAQLRVSQGQGQGATGWVLEGVVFTNVSATPCLLRGYPEISGVTQAGVREAVLALHHGTIIAQNTPADMARGKNVDIWLDTPSQDPCPYGRPERPVTFTRLVFTLPHGGRVSAPADVSISETCSILSMTGFGLLQCYCGTPPPSPLDGLHLRVTTPARVRAGEILSYSVTLTNASAKTVSLRRCPGYTERIAETDENVGYSFELNCATVHEIRAHTSVRYQMQIRVPSNSPPGTGDIGWGIDVPIVTRPQSRPPWVWGPSFTITAH
ncbi:MAG: DUF4232 domain-containing protein [Solirubrobacteraceae bacterium]